MKTKLHILTDAKARELRAAAKSDPTLAAYRSGPSFTFTDAEMLASQMMVESTPPELDGRKHKQILAETEFENARRVYEYVGPIEEAGARDPRLWVALAHTVFHEYCRQRWRPPGDNIEKWRSAVCDHWFVEGGLAALRRHAIARLWWAAHLTRQPTEQEAHLAAARTADEWHYTRLLLANQDVFQGLVERKFGSDRGILLAALAVIGKDRAGRATSPFATALTKEINLTCSYRELGVLPFADLVLLLEEAAVRVEAR